MWCLCQHKVLHHKNWGVVCTFCEKLTWCLKKLVEIKLFCSSFSCKTWSKFVFAGFSQISLNIICVEKCFEVYWWKAHQVVAEHCYKHIRQEICKTFIISCLILMVKNTTYFCFHLSSIARKCQITVNGENVQFNAFLTYVFILADHREPWLLSVSSQWKLSPFFLDLHPEL